MVFPFSRKGVFCNSAIKAAERDHDTVLQTMLQTRHEYKKLEPWPLR